MTNPNYNGIVTTDVISKITKDNLVIQKYFKKCFRENIQYLINIYALPKIICIINSIISKKISK